MPRAVEIAQDFDTGWRTFVTESGPANISDIPVLTDLITQGAKVDMVRIDGAFYDVAPDGSLTRTP